MERKVPKYENHKLRKRKVKTLTRNWRDHRRTNTRKLYRDISTGMAIFFNLKRVNVCEPLESLRKVPSLSCVHKHSLSSDWKRRPCLSKYLDSVSVCVPVLRWSLQFLVRVFTLLSLNLKILQIWILNEMLFTYNQTRFPLSSFKSGILALRTRIC